MKHVCPGLGNIRVRCFETMQIGTMYVIWVVAAYAQPKM